jgi:hypothetical protein
LKDPILKQKPELYKVDCVAYESCMLGIFGIYLGPPNDVAYEEGIPKTNDLHVGYSRDGIAFARPDRTAFLACSREPGTWNRGYLHSAGGCCLIVGDELRFYYAAFSGISPMQGGSSYAGASMGLATLRRDGFVSLDGSGEVTTRLLIFTGQYLFANFDAKDGGDLRVEALDSGGRVIEPFSLRNSIPVKANRTRQAVQWKSARTLRALAGKPVKLSFRLNGGAFYGFWVSPEPTGASHGYVAAGGPGFNGPTDTTGATADLDS